MNETDDTVTQRIFETYVYVLVPEQTAGTRDIHWHQTKPTGSGSLAERIAKKLESEERLITGYGGTRVRMDLDRIPLWAERGDIAVEALWKAYSQFPYLPRLASFDVLAGAISDGVSKLDWATDTFAYADGHDDRRWVGLVSAQHVTVRPGGLVVRPDVAVAQNEADAAAAAGGAGGDASGDAAAEGGEAVGSTGRSSGEGDVGDVPVAAALVALPGTFYAQYALDPVRAIRQLEDILTNVVAHLSSADGSAVELTLEINARADGFDDRVRRVFSENSSHLGAKGQEFE